jgi:hypothetical protein
MTVLPAIVLIVFNRPAKTRVVLSRILQAQPSKLYVVADGPRNGHPEDVALVAQTRSLFDNAFENVEVQRLYSDANLGLRKRVLTGLDEVFKQEHRAIILEDDCLSHPDFFQFASELLQRYEGNEDVGLISGNNFAPNPKRDASYYFSTHPNIWGWATWRRTWEEFRSKSLAMPQEDELELLLRERLPGIARSRSLLQLARKVDKLDSWAVEFSIWSHLNGKLSAVPSVNLVKNIGFGQDSTHTKFESYADEVEIQPLGFPLTHPSHVAASFPEMRRESRIKSLRWIIFPALHPLNFLSRLRRYAKVVLSAAPRK